jgi:hypothetical protein
MSETTLEMLSPEQVDSEWATLEPMLDASCKSNEIGSLDISAADIRQLAMDNMCVLFIMRERGILKVVVAIQFHYTNGHKGADVIAMGGSRLMKFRSEYWGFILDWLKANGCEFVDAYATERLAKIYKDKFGFDRSCVFVRMVL